VQSLLNATNGLLQPATGNLLNITGLLSGGDAPPSTPPLRRLYLFTVMMDLHTLVLRNFRGLSAFAPCFQLRASLSRMIQNVDQAVSFHTYVKMPRHQSVTAAAFHQFKHGAAYKTSLAAAYDLSSITSPIIIGRTGPL
jgi:hypothetical protein